MPFARSRTPAAEPVPGFGLDAPAPQLLQLDMDSDFRPRLLGGASSVSECNWARKALALSPVGYSGHLWRNDASLVVFLPLSSWFLCHVFQVPSSSLASPVSALLLGTPIHARMLRSLTHEGKVPAVEMLNAQKTES